MKQKLEDLMLLLKKDRKAQVGAVLVAVAAGFLLMHNSAPAGSGRKSGMKNDALKVRNSGGAGSGEAYNDIVTAFKSEQDTLKTELADTKRSLEQMQKNSEENLQRTSEIFKRILQRMSEAESTGSNGRVSAVGASIAPGATNNGAAVAAAVTPEDLSIDAGGLDTNQMASLNGVSNSEIQGMESFGSNSPQVAPPMPPSVRKTAFVGAGDSVKVKLLGAVNASTDGTPYPVVFKLNDDVVGPDGSRLPLGEARLIAAAQGSLTDSRALFRLTSLNLSYPDGRRTVLDVDGWIVGEDGVSGMEGILIDPLGKAIGAAAMAGGIEGLGEAFAAKNVSVSSTALGGQSVAITGNESQYAAGKGMSEAAKTWSRLVESRANKLVPKVQVLSGREATAVFSKSFKVPGLLEAYESEDDSATSVD